MLTSALHVSSWTGWFEIDKEHNHNVYVSGLPQDITKEEFVELMSKCGIVTENDDGTRKIGFVRPLAPLPANFFAATLKISSFSVCNTESWMEGLGTRLT